MAHENLYCSCHVKKSNGKQWLQIDYIKPDSIRFLSGWFKLDENIN